MLPRRQRKTIVLRWPSFRRPLDVLFLVACILLTADVLVPEIWGHGKTKDYSLWFWAGQQVLHGGDLYPQRSDDGFAFSAASRDALLAECAADMPGWFGHEEDVEFYADVAGLAALNSALVQCKHRYFLRDGRDEGVRGRAPGGPVSC